MNNNMIDEKYEIKETISNNGTYLCINRNIGRNVVIKKYSQNGDISLEYDILKTINHEYIPFVFDKFILNNEFYFVENFIEGLTLDKFLSENKNLEFDEVLGISIKLSKIIGFLHNNNRKIIHGDIAPQNILINSRNNVFLIDFSTSIFSEYIIEGDSKSEGTVNFFSPEKILIGKNVGFASDIYGFGATLNYILNTLNKIMPLELRAIAKKCMEIRPSNRYLSITDVIEILERI